MVPSLFKSEKDSDVDLKEISIFSLKNKNLFNDTML